MGGDARRFTSSVRGLLLRLGALFDVVMVAVAPLSLAQRNSRGSGEGSADMGPRRLRRRFELVATSDTRRG